MIDTVTADDLAAAADLERKARREHDDRLTRPPACCWWRAEVLRPQAAPFGFWTGAPEDWPVYCRLRGEDNRILVTDPTGDLLRILTREQARASMRLVGRLGGEADAAQERNYRRRLNGF